MKKKDIIITNREFNRMVFEAKTNIEIDNVVSMYEFQQNIPIWKMREEFRKKIK